MKILASSRFSVVIQNIFFIFKNPEESPADLESKYKVIRVRYRIISFRVIKPVEFKTDFKDQENYALGAEFTKDSQFLVTLGMHNILKVWMGGTWEILKAVEAHKRSENAIKLFNGDQRLVSIFTDKKVKTIQRDG